jgi:malonyl-CoA/methylmalonyl-CoA synthetase
VELRKQRSRVSRVQLTASLLPSHSILVAFIILHLQAQGPFHPYLMLISRIRTPCSKQHFNKCREFSYWSFPAPPPPPSNQQISEEGLPLLRQVVQHGNKPFLTDWPSLISPHPLSYQTVACKAATVANYISQHPQRSSNSPFVAHSTIPGSDYISCQWGAFASARASVPLSISQKVPELEHVLRDSNPSMILVSDLAPNHADVLQAATKLDMSDRIVSLQDDILSSSSLCVDPQELIEDRGARLETPALLLYTSGTTGKPKGVLHRHYNLNHQITDLVSAWEWKATDIALHILPLHHVHGVVNVLSCAAYAGAQLQFQPFSAKELWHQWASSTADKVKPNVFMAVPTIYAKLLEEASHLPKEVVDRAVEQTLKPMRLQVSGSAALPVSVLERWKALTDHTLLERYGMTEFAMALSNPYRTDDDSSAMQQRRPGHVGLPLPSVQVRLVDKEDGRILDPEQNPNKAGALQVKGPTVFSEYWNRPDATGEAFTEDGYFDTGDVAEFNSHYQSYRILGRASVDILKVGGHKVSALEVEQVLLEHEDMLEVVILGVPDDVWGERVGMIGRTTPLSTNNKVDGLSLQDIQEWCYSRLEKHKIPTLLVWLDEIPKNAMGKVNKKGLVQLFEDR